MSQERGVAAWSDWALLEDQDFVVRRRRVESLESGTLGLVNFGEHIQRRGALDSIHGRLNELEAWVQLGTTGRGITEEVGQH